MTYASLLAIDTSTGALSIALQHGKTLVMRDGHNEASQATQLMPLIEDVLAEAETDYDALEAIGVSVGPGSFTGIRIGIAVVRGLRLALGIPCYGVSTLEAMAYGFEDNGTVWSLLRAGKGQIYGQKFILPSPNGATTAPSSSTPQLLYPEELLTQSSSNDIWLGNAGELLTDDPRWHASITAPHTLHVMKAIQARAGKDAISPFYIRPPDAVVSKKAL